MSTKVTAKNIYYYLHDVLGGACTGTGWNRETYKRSLGWAWYCEKTAQRVAKKPAEKQLVNLIQQLQHRISDPSLPRSLELEHLQYASDLFRMVLLQNPSISREMFDLITSELRDKDMLLAIPVLRDGYICMEQSLKNQPFSYSLVNGDTYTTTKLQMLEVKLHEKSICNLAEQYQEESKFKYALISFLDSLKICEDTLVILLLFISENNTNGQGEFAKQVILEDWLQNKLNPESIEFNSKVCWAFWKLPLGLLGHISTQSLAFYKLYVRMLVKYAQELEPEYSSNRWKWKVSETKDLKFSPSFHELVQHFSGILNTPGCVNKATEVLLQELCASEKRLLWEDISKAIQKRLCFTL